jgi:hypothetical protein
MVEAGRDVAYDFPCVQKVLHFDLE